MFHLSCVLLICRFILLILEKTRDKEVLVEGNSKPNDVDVVNVTHN